MAKEVFSNQIIVDQFEQAKLAVVSMIGELQSFSGIPNLKFESNFQYRTSDEWKLMGEWSKEAMEASGVYVEEDRQVVINLDKFREGLSRYHQTASAWGVADEDQVLANAVWLVVEEGFIHPSPRVKPMKGVGRILLLDSVSRGFQAQGRGEMAALANNPQAVETKGLLLRCRLKENMLVLLGEEVDETATCFLTADAARKTLVSLRGRTESEWLDYLFDCGVATHQLMDEVGWEGFLEFITRVGVEQFARLYFKSDLLDCFVYNQPPHRLVDSFHQLLLGQTGPFFRGLVSPPSAANLR